MDDNVQMPTSVFDLKSTWDHRRSIIKPSLVGIGALVTIGHVSLMLLAWFKLLTSVAATAIVTSTLALLAVGFMIIGSYVFAAKWEHKDFLDTVVKLNPLARIVEQSATTNDGSTVTAVAAVMNTPQGDAASASVTKDPNTEGPPKGAVE